LVQDGFESVCFGIVAWIESSEVSTSQNTPDQEDENEEEGNQNSENDLLGGLHLWKRVEDFWGLICGSQCE
jgi:hypothetical protein